MARLRLIWDAENECYQVKAKRIATQKWEVIGTCHSAAATQVKAGDYSLIQFNQ